MKPDSSRHRRKCEPRASLSSDGLFQTFPDFISHPADPVKTHLSSVPFPRAPLFLYASSDAGIQTSVLVRKSNLHFLCNKRPVHFRGVLLAEPLHGSTWRGSRNPQGRQGRESPEAGGGLALLGSLKQLPSPLQLTWGWWAAVPLPQRRCFLLSVQVGILERQPSSRAVPSASQKDCEWAQNTVF